MVEFSMYYDIFLISWKTKENPDPIPAKSLWTRSGMYFGIIITRTEPRRPAVIGSFVIKYFGSKKHPRDMGKIEIGVGPSLEYSADLLSPLMHLHIMLFLPPKRPIYDQIIPSF